MMFGPLALCPICSGHLSFSGRIYRCHDGYISEWSKCSHFTLDPDRIKGKWKITENQFLLKWNKSQKSVKPKRNLRPESSAQGQGSKDAADFSRSEKLSDLKVSIAGDTKERQAWKKKIEEAGAEFHSNVKNGTSCLVVCGLTDIRDAEMRKPRRMKVATARVVDCLKKQRKLPLDKYKIEDTFESPVTVKVKERSAVHEASGLQEHCHIFEDGDSIYNTALSISDLSTGINSYFILQIIQEDKGSDCYAFRKWGRVGNEKIGGNKVEEMSKSDAFHEFKRLFLEKTGNSWESWEQKTNFQKQPGKFLPLDIDYGVNKQVAKKEPVQTSSNLAANSSSDLHVQMIRTILSFLRHLLLFLLILSSWTSPCSAATAEATNLLGFYDEQQRHSVDHHALLLHYFEPIKLSLLVMFLVVVVGLIKTFSSCCHRKKNLKKIKKRKSRKDRKGVTGISDPPKQEIDEYDDVVDPPEQEIDEDDDVVDPPEQEIDEDEDDDVVDPPKQGINEFDDVVDLCEDENLICGNKVGKLFVSDKKIADGSKGYVVHEGTYDEHRPAAVKVFDLSHCKNDETESETKNEMDITNDVIQFDNEMDILYDTDSHPNIIRLYGFERLKDYAYLCIERWKYTLEAIPFGSTEEAMWNEVGVPSPLMISLIRNIVSGLQHLHSLKIIHRNLTPSNVVITCNLETLVAKLSDMRISKRLTDGLDHHATSFSYPGWQAPEQIRKKNETYATDMFQLGCVIFYAFTGYHPFGRVKDRKNNILTNNRIKFSQVKHPEAFHLIDILLNPIWNLRPTSSEVLHHPMFWSSLKRLFFLRDASDRVEAFDKKVWDKLSRRKNQVQGLRGWNNKFDKDLVDHIERLGHRQYDYKSLRHLLRFIRNQINHYWEHPVDIQGLVGTYPEGLDKYFTVRFPELFIVVYKFIFEEFMEEDAFKTYFKESTI